MEISQPIIGQAVRQCSAIIVWDAAFQGSRHPEFGHNFIYHEFDHKLDMLDGDAAFNEDEFFAVATEQFFDWSHLLIKHLPKLYWVLKEYCRQDPVSRM